MRRAVLQCVAPFTIIGIVNTSKLIAGIIIAGMASATAPAQTAGPSAPQTQPPPAATARPVPPTRDPKAPGYVTATELADGVVPSPGADGNFIVGPTHGPAPEMKVQDGVPQGA